MPTKPTRKKHGKEFLDEAVAKSGYYKKKITRKRAIYAGIMAFPLGCTGFHDFLLRNKKRALIHLLFSSVAFGMFFLPLLHAASVVYKCRMKIECVDIKDYDDTLNVLVIAGLILLAASIIWGMVEGVIILLNRNRYPEK